MRRGFTLVELLVVISILALLLALGATQFGKFMTAGDEAKAKAQLEGLKVLIEQYRNQTGDYPRCKLSALGIKAPNGLHEGNESLVVALFGRGYDGSRPEEDMLADLEGDVADVQKTIFDSPALLELVDVWGNPIVYLHYADYASKQEYEFTATASGELHTVTVAAAKNPLTGTYHDKESYQLRSVGPDGVYDTDDDITSF